MLIHKLLTHDNCLSSFSTINGEGNNYLSINFYYDYDCDDDDDYSLLFLILHFFQDRNVFHEIVELPTGLCNRAGIITKSVTNKMPVEGTVGGNEYFVTT